MLDTLKSMVRRDNTNNIVMEANMSSDIKDIFLDSMDAAVIGAENDPLIKKLINEIPGYEETDPDFEREVESITESLIFETEL